MAINGSEMRILTFPGHKKSEEKELTSPLICPGSRLTDSYPFIE